MGNSIACEGGNCSTNGLESNEIQTETIGFKAIESEVATYEPQSPSVRIHAQHLFPKEHQMAFPLLRMRMS